ncbi:hypothetical protein G6038_27240 [Rhodococcus sp. 14C212]|nr:hypothetical protein [Rhodococcus sp. 14C212]
MSMPGSGADPVTVDRLVAEFGDDVPRAVVEAVVVAGVDDLSGVPEPDLPELGERLARQRLLNLVKSRTTAVP